MAKVSYVPYSDDYNELFTLCGISLSVSDFGGNEGWAAPAFAQALQDAMDWLNAQCEADPDLYDEYEQYFELGDYEIFYWSVENYNQV